MKNTNITRTVNTATATVTYFDIVTEKVAKETFSVYTTQKVTEKDFRKEVESHNDVKVLKVSEITYTSELYEMDLQTFVQNAKKVGDGRITL